MYPPRSSGAQSKTLPVLPGLARDELEMMDRFTSYSNDALLDAVQNWRACIAAYKLINTL